MFIACVCTALAIAALWPDTPIGKRFRYWLIEAPAQHFPDLKLAKAVGVVVFFLAVIAIAHAFPPELALLGAVDASAFMELLVAAGLLAAHFNALAVLRRLRSTARAVAAWGASQVRAIRPMRRPTVRARSLPRPRFKPKADDDDGRTLVLA
jgi:hypothetical protein